MQDSKPSPPSDSGHGTDNGPVEGLARLDADSVADDTPIEQKIEEVAEAMGLGGAENKGESESPPAEASASKGSTASEPARQVSGHRTLLTKAVNPRIPENAVSHQQQEPSASKKSTYRHSKCHSA